MTTAGLWSGPAVSPKEAQSHRASKHLQEDGVALNIGFCSLLTWVIRIPHGG